MSVRAVLHAKAKKDGSHLIKIYTYQEGKTRYKGTGHHVLPEHWDAKKDRVKPIHPNADLINADIADALHKEECNLVSQKNSYIRFVEQYIDECNMKLHGIAEDTVKRYGVHLSKIGEFIAVTGANDLTYGEINQKFYRDYLLYFSKKGNGSGTLDNEVKYFKKFLKLSFKQKLHRNEIFSSDAFKRIKVRTKDKIYLTLDEISQLYDFDMSEWPIGYQKERDRWLVAYFLMIRFSDSITIRKGDFFDHEGKTYFRNNAKKTNNTKYVPVASRCKTLLERNNYSFSTHNQVANKYIKKIAEACDINEMVGEVPKYQLVKTHTARRSMATHLHQSGMDNKLIMQLGGWDKESSFKAYLLSSDMQLAIQAASNSLFD